MAREQFIDSLRLASRMLAPPIVSSEQGARTDAYLASSIHLADLWLTPKSVEGFNKDDFPDWPAEERRKLKNEVAAFLAIAGEVPANRPATRSQSHQARKHLERAIQIVRKKLLSEWLAAQQLMMHEAAAAAQAKGWHVQEDEKEILESLLGRYHAPRLRIRTQDSEVVLDPVARFGSGGKGVVDLVVMPTYETACLISFKNGEWQIDSLRGTARSMPFTQAKLVNTITNLPRC